MELNGNRRRVLAAAIGAAVVLAVAGLVLFVGVVGDDDGGEPAAPTTTTPETTVATAPTSTNAPSTTAPPSTTVATDRAVDAARRWVDAARRGDTAAGWELLGPQSRAFLGNQAALADLMRSALREGWGAWGSSPDLALVAHPLAERTGERLLAVSFTGTVSQEGPPQRSGALLVARVGTAGSATVEPFAAGRAADLLTVPPTLATGRPATLHIPGGAAGYVVVLDGALQPAATLQRDAQGDIRAWRPATPLSAGRHTLAAAYLAADGTLTTAWSTFEATA